MESIIIGGGCFWCLEAIFQRLTGVIAVTSGYTAGVTPNPDYKSVCAGITGHAEVIQVDFDPTKIDLPTLLQVFFGSHDPTTLNRQGNDIGTQYRSIIVYNTEEQKAQALQSKKTAQPYFDQPIVTQICELDTFYKAEDYHHDYFNKNPNQGYCNFVISPKVAKLRANYSHLLES